MLVLPQRIALACADLPEFEGYSFFRANLIDLDSEIIPYFFSFDQMYSSFEAGQEKQTISNLEEWQDIFCDQATLKDLQRIIYKSSLSELKSLRTAVQNKKYPIPPNLRSNTFAQHLKAHRCNETINYLIFAKECEPHVIRPTNLWNGEARDKVMMQALIDDGKDIFRKTKSNYIRLRYAYQLVRLAHYQKDYTQALELLDYLLPKIDPIESLLNDWILGHRAGALMSLGQNVEASYLFSLIFRRCPEKRASAFQSFHIKTDEEWEACLLMCQDDEERATLYALRASESSRRAPEEMAKIYQLDPQSKSLELLLVREIRELEKDLLGLEFNDQKRENALLYARPRKQAGLYAVKLLEFTSQVIAEGKVAHLPLWKLSSAYLEYLSGDFYAAEQSFSRLEKEIGEEEEDKELREQLAAFQLALRINNFESIEEEDEAEIAEIITENPLYKAFSDFPDFLNDRLAYVYKKQGNPGKAFRCQYNISALRPYPQMDIIEDLLAVCHKPEPTKFERALITKANGEYD